MNSIFDNLAAIRNELFVEYVVTFADDLSGRTPDHEQTIAHLCFKMREEAYEAFRKMGHNSSTANIVSSRWEANLHQLIVQHRKLLAKMP